MMAPDLLRIHDDPEWMVLDVRSVDEYMGGHVPGSVNTYFGTLSHNLDKVPRDKHLAVYCTGGVRSGMACSILLRNGYTDVHNVLGGFPSWRASGFITEF